MHVPAKFAAVCLALAVVPAAYADVALSPLATKILAKLKTRADINTVCRDEEALRSAVRDTVRSMVASGEVQGRPVDAAQEAGRAAKQNCGRL